MSQLRPMNCELRTTDCRLRTADCRLETADCRLRTADCRLETADCRLPTPPKRQCLKGFPHFLFVAMLLVALNLSAQNPFIQHYTTSDGLPSNYVFEIYQDSKKFIWLSMTGGGGLVRYDGSTFTTYRRKDGLSYYQVGSISEDSFGRIWLRCSNGMINFFYQNKIYNSTNTPFLDSIKGFWFFFQDKDPILYFYSPHPQMIYALDTNNRITKYEIPGIQEGNHIITMTKSVTGEFLIWAGPGVYKTRNLSQKPTLLSSICCEYDIVNFDNQNVYVRILNPKTRKYIYVKYFNGFPVDSTELPVKTEKPGYILDDANGLLWICTYDQGVFCLKNKQIVYHLDIKEADEIMQDHENNIWIGTRKKGVYKISPYFLYSKHYDSGYFKNEGIEALGSYPKNGVWCTNGERIYLLNNNEIFNLDFHITPWKPNWTVYGINNNRLIIGNSGGFDDNFVLTGIRTDPLAKKVYFKHTFKLPDLFKIAIDKTGREVSAFTLTEEPLKYGRVVTYSLENQFSEINRVDIYPFYGGLFYNANNDLIINAEKNYILRNNKKLPIKELSRFNGKVISSHYDLNRSTELYFIEDSIYLINNNKIYNLTSSFSYPIDQPIRRVKYDEPMLYLSTVSNVYKCDNPLQILKNRPVDLQLVDINFHNIHDILVKNDSLYVASDDGLTVIPGAVTRKINPHVPIPYFQSILVNDKETDLSKQNIILTGSYRIKFIFSSINYSSTPVFYSYMLEGADHDWSKGTGRIVVYQDLPAGNYDFKLRTSKPNLEWSKPIEFKITIKAHFWQHPLFFVFLALLFTGIISLIIIRRKNIQIKRRELDHQLITLEQKALQSMMNPHFIFNSLGSIQNYLLQKKSSEAGLYLSQFARLIRQNLNAINAASINLEEEIDRLKNYLDLEKLRMEDKFEYNIEVAENVEADEVQIPSMIIQPFVENAIWHGIALLEEKGQIVIKFLMQDDKSLTVIVEDNGIGMKRSETYSAKREKHLNLGMEMTRKRLEILGKKFSVNTCLKFSEMFPGNLNPGTRVEMVVPVSTSDL